jgi:hypothetical protein
LAGDDYTSINIIASRNVKNIKAKRALPELFEWIERKIVLQNGIAVQSQKTGTLTAAILIEIHVAQMRHRRDLSL